ncbi:MAG: hypothetical protein CMJ46_07275 [Planctomyces sp.]|nr:hypothetical protein [Planctomyces sp.]
MTIHGLDKLAELVKQHRHVLLSRWRQQGRQLASAQRPDTPTLNDHIPVLLDELAAALPSRSEPTWDWLDIPVFAAKAEGKLPDKGNFDLEPVPKYIFTRNAHHFGITP